MAVIYWEGKKEVTHMDIRKHYEKDPALRQSFNALAEETFGLNFENWYQSGFWQGDYVPYSLILDGQVVANVSLNRTDMVIHGEEKRLYQLGTVMTRQGYRGRGYIRSIMAEIEKDIADADGVYLFANDSVLSFYPKFGFQKAREYVYSKDLAQAGTCRMEQMPMACPRQWHSLQRAMEASTFPAACQMVHNPGLIFFYVTQFMQECVYYCPDLNTWVIGEIEDGALTLHCVFTHEAVSLEDVLAAFGSRIRSVTLGFTPENPAGYTCRELREEDTTFFVKGQAFRDFSQQRLRIPSLSHA